MRPPGPAGQPFQTPRVALTTVRAHRTCCEERLAMAKMTPGERERMVEDVVYYDRERNYRGPEDGYPTNDEIKEAAEADSRRHALSPHWTFASRESCDECKGRCPRVWYYFGEGLDRYAHCGVSAIEFATMNGIKVRVEGV